MREDSSFTFIWDAAGKLDAIAPLTTQTTWTPMRLYSAGDFGTHRPGGIGSSSSIPHGNDAITRVLDLEPYGIAFEGLNPERFPPMGGIGPAWAGEVNSNQRGAPGGIGSGPPGAPSQGGADAGAGEPAGRQSPATPGRHDADASGGGPGGPDASGAGQTGQPASQPAAAQRDAPDLAQAREVWLRQLGADSGARAQPAPRAEAGGAGKASLSEQFGRYRQPVRAPDQVRGADPAPARPADAANRAAHPRAS